MNEETGITNRVQCDHVFEPVVIHGLLNQPLASLRCKLCGLVLEDKQVEGDEEVTKSE